MVDLCIVFFSLFIFFSLFFYACVCDNRVISFLYCLSESEPPLLMFSVLVADVFTETTTASFFMKRFGTGVEADTRNFCNYIFCNEQIER